jgi:hypothetical protein
VRMLTIEERVQTIIEANWGNKQALIDGIAREMHLLRCALPAASYLDSVASHLEDSYALEIDLPDGSTFNGPEFLRQAAQLVRLTINEEDDGVDDASISAT